MNFLSKSTANKAKFGDEHFLSLYCSILARLAYFNDNFFFAKYCAIMGSVIDSKILASLNTPGGNVLDDQTIFKLNDPNNPLSQSTYEYNGKKYIDYLKLNIPQNVNIINGEMTGAPTVSGVAPADQVQYISIGWSNYGEVFIVADKRMPNTILVIFRGTYSGKTAALYTKPTSLKSLKICPGTSEEFLYGIYKPTVETIHTIIESIQFLATKFLNQTAPNSVRIITTGQSLGGAMTTNFAYLWQKVKTTAPYNAAPYTVISKKIICVSLGAPRSMGSYVAQQFCNMVKQGDIVFLRIVSGGDPVTGMPFKVGGFEHPCSSNPQMRNQVVETCNALYGLKGANYAGNIDCRSDNTAMFVPNLLNHAVYLDIMYFKVLDIEKLLSSMVTQQEVKRTPSGETMARLIWKSAAGYRVIFFNLNLTRQNSKDNTDLAFEQDISQPTQGSKLLQFGGQVQEDIKMTPAAYKSLIEKMVPIPPGDLCPMQGKTVNPFNQQTMPYIGCSFSRKGGRKTRKRKQYKKKSRRNRRIK